MNPQDSVTPIRHHLTVVCSDPRWDVEEVAAHFGDLLTETADGHAMTVEVFDESYELDSLRKTRDQAFRVIGTGAIKMLEQGDEHDRFRSLVAALNAFVEEGKNFTSTSSTPDYIDGEEDGYATAIQRLEKLIEKFE